MLEFFRIQVPDQVFKLARSLHALEVKIFPARAQAGYARLVFEKFYSISGSDLKPEVSCISRTGS